MENKSKKFVAAMAMGMALSLGFAPLAAAEPADTEIEVNVKVAQSAIDWTKGSESDITAVGIGLPGGKGMAMARRGAIMDAQRNLLEIIKGVSIDSEALMEDLMVQSDVVKTQVNGLLKGAQILDEGQNADGSYFVKMRVPLYGSTQSLASVAVPKVRPHTAKPKPAPVLDAATAAITKEEIKEAKSAAYTGVVVDASSLGLVPTFSPIIYDVNGRAVYGIDNIESSVAINSGMVGYANSVEDAASGSRAGANPLVVPAVEARGGKNSANPVNVVVSVEDADRILAANEASGFLSGGAVMFVK